MDSNPKPDSSRNGLTEGSPSACTGKNAPPLCHAFRDLVGLMPQAALLLQGQELFFANPAALRLLGRDFPELQALGISGFLEIPGDGHPIGEILAAPPSPESPCHCLVRVLLPEDHSEWLDAFICRIGQEPDPVTLFLFSGHDLDAESSLLLDAARRMFETSIQGIFYTSQDGRIRRVNQAYCRIMGIDESEALGKEPSILGIDSEPGLALRLGIEKDGHWQGELPLPQGSRGSTPVWTNVMQLRPSESGHGALVGALTDLSHVREIEAQLHHLTHFDPITGLPNRQLFMDRLSQALLQSLRDQSDLAVVCINLHRFRKINETLGSQAGDDLLRQVSQRLLPLLRESDTLSRLHADEFAILLPRSIAPQVSRVTSRIMGAFDHPFRIGRSELLVSASAGIALAPTDGREPEELLLKVSQAAEEAQQAGRNNYRFYSGAVQAWARERLEMEWELRRGLDRDEFVLHYQPRVDLTSGTICGMEALLRWQHPRLGLVPPMDFIPLAEETGLIIPLGEWVLNHACAETLPWTGKSPHPLRMSVNISGLMFRHHDLSEKVERVLNRTGLSPCNLEIELTESIVMGDQAETLRTLHELKGMDVHLSIDDFGTGYSSLGYLKRFPIDCIKIDRSFVQDIPHDTAIAEAVIAMSHGLRMRVVAEGVETAEQLAFLDLMHCDEIQGFYFSRPLPPERFEALLGRPQPFNIQ